MTDEDAEKAFTAWDEGYGFMTGNLGRLAFMAGRESQRSRIAALEGALRQAPHDRICHSRAAVGFPSKDYHECDCWKSSLAPSSVLDGMIRKARADGWDERHAMTCAWAEDNPYREETR